MRVRIPPYCPCSVGTWCRVHGFQAPICVLPEKEWRCVVPCFSRRLGAKGDPVLNFRTRPALDIEMRFDERESDPPCTYRAWLWRLADHGWKQKAPTCPGAPIFPKKPVAWQKRNEKTTFGTVITCRKCRLEGLNDFGHGPFRIVPWLCEKTPLPHLGVSL